MSSQARTFRSLRTTALLVTVALLPLCAGATTAGRTPGTFTVSPTGAANYTIPIWAPRGPNGLQPNISLQYNSQAGNGPLGMGWSVAGLGAIYRCPQTIAQDGIAGSVALTYADRFCMDGKRLRLTSSDNSSTYGADGTTYQTEVADLYNVTAHRAAGNGPMYFTVQGRDGLTYEYGNTTDSRVLADGTTASAWMLDKVTDRALNTIAITYKVADANLKGMTVPASIAWTPVSHSATTYAYTMIFTYQTLNLAPISGYLAGQPVQDFYSLTSIQVQSSGTTVKNYVLAYSASQTTGRQTLTSVTECADAGATNCLAPTTVGYQQGTQGLGSANTWIPLSALSTSADIFSEFDVNGDGRNDLVWRGSNGTFQVALATGTGYSAPIDTGIVSSYSDIVGAPLDGTGQDEFIEPVSGVFYYYKWNGTGFTATSTGISSGTNTDGTYVLADVDGDGRPDLITTGTDGFLYVWFNTSQNGTVSFNSTAIKTISSGYVLSTSTLSTRKMDFTGSGQQDLLGYSLRSHTLYILHFNGSTFVVLNGFGAGIVDFGDFNDDGCTDVLFANELVISQCAAGASQVIPLPAVPVAAIDWDGDGRLDILAAGSGTMNVYLSNGSGFSPDPVATSVPSPPYYQVLRLDNPTGDGLEGLVTIVGGSANAQYYLHNGAGQRPDLLNSVSDGLQNSVKPTYASIAQSSTVYTQDTNATYPYQNFIGPMYVVNQVNLSDPTSSSGGSYTQTFSYKGAWKSLQGRGFLGFEQVQHYDSRNALWDTSIYDVKFPWTGILDWHLVSHDQARNQKLSDSYVNRVSTTLDNTANNQRTFVYVNDATSNTYEVGGSKDGQLIKTVDTTYAYGTDNYNYGQPTSVVTTVTDSDSLAPASPYSGDVWTTTTTTTISPDSGSNWCLTQPTQISVTTTAPGVSAITRTTTFVPDYAMCRQAQQVTAPSTAYAVTQVNGYDSFGNLSSIAVTGAGMGTRTTSVNWGTTGQFPMTITNPLNQVTSFGYDLSQGMVSSFADPNGITTSWLYDSFQRKKQENRPDGTYTTWTFTDCAVSGTCLVGTHGVVRGKTVYNKDGSVQTDGTTWFDPLDRKLVRSRRMLAPGAYDRNEVRYDSLGRVVSKAMPCTWVSLTTTCPYMETIAYDALGRILSTTRQKDANSPGTMLTTSMSYLGDTSVVTDPQGQTTAKVISAAGTLVEVVDDNSYGENFVYDGFGSLLTVTDRNLKRLFTAQYAYGLGAYQTDATDVDMDVSTAAGQHRHFTYDALGEMTAWSDANGHSSSETYDALGRPLVRTEPDLTTTWTWGALASSFNIGKLASVVAGSFTENYSYDSSAHLIERKYINPQGTFTYDWAYNSNTGLLDTLSYPTSTSAYRLILRYGYQNGLLQNIADANAPTTVFWTSNGTNARGQVTEETLGNGVITNRAFDAVTGWISSTTSGLTGSTSLQNESYLFDDLGNLIQRQNNNAGLTENFYYQGDYRLDHSTLGGTQNLGLSYDLSGNITARSDVAGNSPWTYDANRVHAVTQTGVGGYSYTYDSNGNVTSRNGSPITWTSFNHPLKIVSGAESVTFAYNQNHDRASAAYTNAGGGIETTYFAAREMEIVVGVGGVTDYRHYIFAGDEKVAAYSRMSTGSNTLRYLREDHQGSVAAMLNSDGTCYAKESFTAFGARRSACTWTGPPTNGDLNLINAVTRDGYTWQMALGNMGLNDMHGRIEDAITGRFLSPDPHVQDPSNTQDFNRYAYARNNPLSLKDPTGFDVVCEDPEDPSTCEVIVQSPPVDPGQPDPGEPGNPGVSPPPPVGPPPPPRGPIVPRHGPAFPQRNPPTQTPPPQGQRSQPPPCQTFAEDMAARNPTAPTANDVKNAVSALTDTFGTTGDLGADLARSLGRESTSLETLGRTGAYAGLLFAAYDVGHAYHTGNAEDRFDAGYGTVALVAGAFVPPFGAGMAIAKVGSSLITPSESNILEQAAQPTCQPVN